MDLWALNEKVIKVYEQGQSREGFDILSNFPPSLPELYFGHVDE